MNRKGRCTTAATLALTTLILAACGGGAGSGGSGAPPPAATHSVGGVVNGLTGSGLVLRNDAGGDSLSIGAGGSFTFTARVANGGAYDIVVGKQPDDQSCSVANGTGTIAGADITNVTVSCKARAWGTAAQVVTDDGLAMPDHAVDPAVAIDSGGDTTVVWVQSRGSRTDIWANRYRASTKTWGAPVPIESDNAGSAARPRVAVDPEGNATAVWCQSNGIHAHIWANRYGVATDSWGVPTRLDPDHPGDAFLAEVAVDALGSATAVWTQPSDDGAHFQIWANRTTAGTWGTAVRLDHLDADAAFPQVAVGTAGHPIVVWQQPVGSFYRVWASRYTGTNDAWSGAALVETGLDTGHSERPAIAVAPDGNAVAAWQWSDGVAGRLYASRYDAATNLWGTERLLPLDTGFALSAHVAIDPDGNAITSWQQLDGTPRNRMWANRFRTATGAWGTATGIESSSIGDTLFNRIAMDGFGNAIVVWQQHDGSYPRIYASRYRAATGAWAASGALETQSATAGAPEIALDSGGDGVAVWSQYDGALNTIWMNRYQ